MELSPRSHHQQQGDFPNPMSSTTYGEDHGGNEHHLVNVPHDHHHHDHDDRHPDDRATRKDTEVDEDESCRYRYKYRECMKNHAAALGGNARDGCGEFIPNGTGEEEEEEDSLICSACTCHRNFHRKELLFVLPHEHPPQFDHHHHHHHHHHNSNVNKTPSRSRNFIVGYPAARTATVLPMIMSSRNRLHHVHAGAGGGGVPGSAPGSASVKKRIRTKFSQEQREKMLNFAERVGWKIQKQEDCVVQRFCQEIGVKRRVLKVWMHNNKHNLAKNKK